MKTKLLVFFVYFVVFCLPLSALDVGGFDSSRAVIADANAFVDSADSRLFSQADNQTLVLNAIAFAVPEPAAMPLIAAAALVCADRRGRWCSPKIPPSSAL